MLVKIEARILIFPGTDFHFPSTSVPPGTFFRLCNALKCAAHTTQRTGEPATVYVVTIVTVPSYSDITTHNTDAIL